MFSFSFSFSWLFVMTQFYFWNAENSNTVQKLTKPYIYLSFCLKSSLFTSSTQFFSLLNFFFDGPQMNVKPLICIHCLCIAVGCRRTWFYLSLSIVFFIIIHESENFYKQYVIFCSICNSQKLIIYFCPCKAKLNCYIYCSIDALLNRQSFIYPSTRMHYIYR